MDEIKTISYKNKEILYLDFSGCGSNKERTLNVLRNIFPVISTYPPQSVLTLTNVDNLFFNIEILNEFKDVQTQIKTYQKKAAVIGIYGLQKIAYKAVTTLTSDHFTKTFESEIQAKEWLIS